MLYYNVFRRLHCPRNTVHVNLFISFMMRALGTLLKDCLMPGGALQKDLIVGPNNETYFNEDSGSVSSHMSVRTRIEHVWLLWNVTDSPADSVKVKTNRHWYKLFSSAQIITRKEHSSCPYTHWRKFKNFGRFRGDQLVLLGVSRIIDLWETYLWSKKKEQYISDPSLGTPKNFTRI